MINKKHLLRIATLGRIGYLPGSGTIASLCMVPLLYVVRVPLFFQMLCIAVFFGVSFFIIKQVLPLYRDNDPSEIVIDECLGMLIAVCGLPISWLSLFLAFMVFRLLDISKFFGLSLFERFAGAWGILLDDIAAACITNIILRYIVPLACQ